MGALRKVWSHNKKASTVEFRLFQATYQNLTTSSINRPELPLSCDQEHKIMACRLWELRFQSESKLWISSKCTALQLSSTQKMHIINRRLFASVTFWTLHISFPYCSSYFLTLLCTFLWTVILSYAALGSWLVISWGNLVVFLGVSCWNQKSSHAGRWDMSACPLCPLTWFRRIQRQSKATSKTAQQRNGSGRFEKNKWNWFWLPDKCTRLASWWSWCMWVRFGAFLQSERNLLQMRDLGIWFTLAPGAAAVALKLIFALLGRSSSSNPCCWSPWSLESTAE